MRLISRDAGEQHKCSASPLLQQVRWCPMGRRWPGHRSYGPGLGLMHHTDQPTDHPLLLSPRTPAARFQAPRAHPSSALRQRRVYLHHRRENYPPGRVPMPATSCLGAFRTPASSVRGAPRHRGVQKPAQHQAPRLGCADALPGQISGRGGSAKDELVRLECDRASSRPLCLWLS